MVKKINTYTSLADFEALGKRIESAASTPFELVQVGLVAAFQHIEKHGNVNMLRPIVTAVERSFRNRGMVNKVRAFIVEFTWLDYNARGYKPAQLRDAQFDTVWTKNKSKKMNVDGATAKKWYEQETQRSSNDQKVTAPVRVNSMIKQLQTLLNDRKLVDADGTLMTVGKLKTLLKATIESLEAPKVTVTDTGAATKQASKPRKAAAKKAAPKAANDQPAKAA